MVQNINNSLILSAAVGYEPNKVEVFLNSLNSVNFEGTVILLVSEGAEESFTTFYKKYNFTFKVIYQPSAIGVARKKHWYRTLKPLINAFLGKKLDQDSHKKYEYLKKYAYPHVSRFQEFIELVKAHSEYDYVMITDARDVYFQQHPFSEFKGVSEPRLCVGIENTNVPIKQDTEYSVAWIRDVYGEAMLRSIQDNPICCAGVTIGDYASILAYLNTMVDEFLRIPYATMTKSNYDQGIHDTLLYTGAFTNVKKCYALNSCISTMGLFDYSEVAFDDEGDLLLENGEKAVIVHQYDRHPEWKQRVRSQYMKS